MKLIGLYKEAHEISEDMMYENKYTWLGYNKIIKAKYLDINDTFVMNTKINPFIIKYEKVFLLPNFVNGKLLDLMIKPFNTNEQILEFKVGDLPYGIGEIPDTFKFGDTLFIVEGVGDYGGLKLIDRNVNVIATRTNAITSNMYKFISSITNRVVIIPDNDEPGRKHIRKMKTRFADLGVSVSIIEQFGSLKDTGEIVDIVMSYQKSKSSTLKTKLETIYSYYLQQINMNKWCAIVILLILCDYL